MMSGWELMLAMAIDPAEIETICVRVNGEFGEIPVDQAEHWLSQMPMFTSHEDEDWVGQPYAGREDDFRFQIWTAERIFFTRLLEGIVVLSVVPRKPERWMKVNSRTEKVMTEIGSGATWRYGVR